MNEGPNPELFTGPLYAAIISLIAGFVRFVISAKAHSIIGLFRGLIVAVFVGWNMHYLTQHYGIKPDLQAVLVSGSAFVADFVLIGFLKMAEDFSKEPKQYIKDWFARGTKKS